MLAAELHAYSYANYENHLGIGNIRFDELMPHDVDILERAEREQWNDARIAEALEIPEEKVEEWQRSFQEAKAIVDAPTAAESFRRGVRYSILYAIENGLTDEGAIERLVTQICYRAADFGFLLDMEGKRLSDYSKELRKVTKYDLEDMDKRIKEALRKPSERKEEDDSPSS